MNETLVFCAISLHQMAGGLEKNIVLLANHFSEKKYNVEIITFDLPGSKSFYSINPNVIWHQTGVQLPHRSISFADRFKVLKNIHSVLNSKQDLVLIIFHHGILFRFFLSTFFKRKK